MDAFLLSRLERADDPERMESPRGFEWDASIREVKALAAAVSAAAGHDVKVDDGVEDASFFADLEAYDPPVEGVRHPILIVRFSAFGRLFTIPATRLPSAIGDRVVAVVEAGGWVHVPYDEIDGVPYTGPNLRLRGCSWAIRFFDYL